MKYLSKILSFFLMAFIVATALAGCSNGKKNDEASMMNLALYDQEGKKLLEINEQNKVLEIRNIISSRKPLLEKIMPVLDLKIIIKVNGTSEEWLYSKGGYLKENAKDKTQIFKLEKAKSLNSVLMVSKK